MLLSMTGFSTKSTSFVMKGGENCSLAVEVKTLNSRFFEAVCKLPNSLSHLELDIINMLKEKLVRGRVYLTIRISGEAGLLEILVPSVKVVQDYVAAARDLKKQFKLAGELNISDIVTLPHVFSFDKNGLTDKEEKAILTCVDESIELLIKSRAVEGKALQKDLDGRFKLCSEYIVRIGELFEKLMTNQKDHIKRAISSAQSGHEESRAQLDEMYACLNKIDVHEEITRFNSHLQAIKLLLKSKQPDKGRRLDFILQELMRETNTITAKCSSFDISSTAVDIKVELEKAREQVQNIV